MRKLNLNRNIKDSVIKDYTSGNTLTAVGSKYGISTWKVIQLLDEQNIPTRKNRELRRIYKCNSFYFSKINTKEKAYFLGLLFADGWNNEAINSVGIQIKALDVKVLNILKEQLSFDGPIYDILRNNKNPKHSDLKRLVIRDIQISQDLAKLGCEHRKTFSINKIPNIPEHLVSHFIRGYFDGDGSIHISKGNLFFQLVGNEQFLINIRNTFVKEIKANKNNLYGKKITKSLCYGGNNICRKIYEFIYEDCDNLFMNRKKEVFERIWNS